MRFYKYKTPTELENVVNRELKLQDTMGSGCVKGDGDGKGKSQDGVTYLSIINDSKFTDRSASSISFSLSDWNKTEKAAQRYGRIPIMTRGDLSGRVYVLLDLDDFRHIHMLATQLLDNTKE